MSEAENPAEDEWGEDALIAAARSCFDLPSMQMITHILAAADAFAAGAPQHDDMTLVVARVLYGQLTLRPHDATEADVTGGGVDRVRVTGGRPVAAAIVRRTQVGAAFEHFARNPDLGLRGVVARIFGAATRIVGNAAGFLPFGGMARVVPVRGPLPYVADHVVAVRIRSAERRRPERPLVSVAAEVLPRKLALPGIGHMPALAVEFVTPGVVRAVETPTGGELPLRFRRQFLARPLCVCLDIAIRDVYGRVVFQTLDRAFRPQRMAHVRTLVRTATRCRRSRSTRRRGLTNTIEPA